MYRQTPGRNHRSRGVKVKSILQICLLLAVCFWLIYQVKHSHDKKKEFDESDSKAALETAGSDELARFGRKDIRQRVEGAITNNENQDEPSDEEEVSGEEAEEIKHDEDEVEEKKVEGKEDEAMGGGDDEETDDHEEEKSDAEVDREQEWLNGDERERETQGADSEDGHAEIEKEDSDRDGDDGSTHEAREEHYKADDASSAVSHDAQIVTTENVNERVEEENKESNPEETYKSEGSKELEVGGGEVAIDGHPSNVTTSETKVADGSSANNTVLEGSNGHLTSNMTTEVTIENHSSPSENATDIKPESNHGLGNLTEGVSSEESNLQNIDSEKANNSTLNVDSTRLGSNSTVSADNSTASSAAENVLIAKASIETGNNTEFSLEKKNEVEGEKLVTSDGTDESLQTTLSENPEEVKQDAIDISDTSNDMEEKDVRMDLDTLPEIQTEGTDNEDAAAE